MSLFATGSGQRHVRPLAPADDEDECQGTENAPKHAPPLASSPAQIQENSVKLWWCGDYAPAVDGET